MGNLHAIAVLARNAHKSIGLHRRAVEASRGIIAPGKAWPGGLNEGLPPCSSALSSYGVRCGGGGDRRRQASRPLFRNSVAFSESEKTHDLLTMCRTTCPTRPAVPHR